MAQKLDRSYFGTGNRKTATGTNKKDTSSATETVQKLDRSHFNKTKSAPTTGASLQKKTTPATAPAKQSRLPMDNVGRKNTANSRLLQDIQKREPRDTGNTPSFADRVTNTVKGGAKSSAAAYTNVGGVLAEGAGYLNTRIANQNAGAALQSDHDAVKQYEKMLRDVKWADGKPMTAADVQQVQKYLSAAKRRIAAHEGYTKAVEQSDKEVADKAYRKADELAGSAQADLERAKEGTGFLGNMLVDAGASMTQTGLDAIPSILTGGALGMAPFAVRAFGGATQQARQDGADYKGQLLYGTASAAKEVFTEKMFNIALPFAKAYGGGALDDVVKRGIRSAVDKFAKTEAGKKALGSALTFGAGAVGEGLEEFIGDWMEWQLPRIYGGDVATAQETLSDSLYDFLVGATSGAMGGMVSPNTYRYDLGTQQGVQERADVQEGTPTAPAQTSVQAAQTANTPAVDQTFRTSPVSMEEQVLRQREAAVQKTFTGIADKLGDSGRKAFQAAYQGTDRGDYAGEFLRAYHAGMTNQENPNSTSAVSFAAYTAGQNDAAASLAREKRAAQFAKTAGTDSGLVFDDYVSQKMNSAIADEVNTVAKALGVRVQMADQVLGGSANGNITGSEIRIAKEAQDPALQVVGHEWTHRVQELAPEQYRSFRDAVASIPDVQEAAQILLEQYNRHGVETSYEQALDEATANYAGKMIANSDVLDDFIRKHSADRTLLQKLRDAIHEIVGKLTGRAKRQAQTVEGKLQAAFEAASKQAESLQNRQTNGTISETRYAAKGKYWRPNLTQKEWSLLNRHMEQEIADSTHTLDEATQWAYANEKGNQVFAIYGIGDGTEATPLYASGGKTAAADYQAFMKGGKEFDYGTDRSAEALNRVLKTLRREQRQSNGNFSDAQRGIAATGHERVSAERTGNDGRKGTGDGQENRRVSTKFSLKTDSQGRELTEQQREYFKDSKVVDSDGQLKVMYRGGTGDFTVFDRKKSSYSNLYGRGFYFTDSEAHAKQYGNAKAFYLNITAPVSTTETTITRDQMRKFLKAVAANEDDFSFENYGYDATVSSVLKSVYGKSDFAMLYDVNQTAIGDMVAAVELFNEVNGTNYDGLILDTETVAFRSNQIKNVDNKAPTDNPDIRFSLKSVPAVQPESNDWRPGATFAEVKAAHPTLFELAADEADTRNPTQITGTVKSYRKIYDALEAEGFDGTILDASSGLGYGTRAGREEYGFRVDDIEPFPDSKYQPKYTDYSTLDKTYDVIISNAVLNVIPQDLRDAMVVKIGEMLNPGGRAFINVRGTDVKNAGSKVAINDDLMEYFISNTGSYQKGFTSRELVAYLKDALGDGFTVEPTKKFGAVSAIVTRDADGGKSRFSLKNYSDAEQRDHRKKAIAFFGKTYNWNETGYLTPAGTKLDFSGKHEGGPGGYRTVDHRDIRDAISEDYGGDDYSGSMVQFMSEGNIRISPESGGINLSVEPTKSQLDALADFIGKNRGEVILDLDTPDGQTISSTEYPRGTHSSKVLNDIKAYFKDGTTPRVSEVSQFLSLKGTENAQEIAALKRENESLKERVEYWKGQTRRSQGVTTDRKSVQKAADALVKDYGAEISGSDIAGDLQSLYDYIASGKDGKDELTYAEARRRSDAIAERIAESAVEVDDRAYKEYAGLRKYLKDTKLTLTEADAAEITDFNEFRKGLFGKLKISKGEHTNVDQIYSELSNQYPEFFNEAQETNISDQVQRIADVANRLYKVTEYNPFEGYMGQAVASISNDIMDRFFDLPQTKKTFADRAAEQVQEARFQGRQAANDAFLAGQMSQGKRDAKRLRSTAQALAKERTRRAEQVQALKERYREKDVTRRDNQKRRELRAKIVRHANALSQKLLRPTDNQHIPEYMRSAVAKVLESINQESSPNARSFTLDPVTKERIYKDPGTPTNRTVAFQNLQEQYQRIVKEGDMVVDPSLLGGDDVAGGFSEVIKMGDTRLADLTTEQLKTMWNVLKSVEHSVTTAGKTLASEKFATTKQFADALRMDGMTRRRKLGNNVAISLETPYTFFAHFGQTGKDIYRMLRNAQDRQEIMARDVAEKVHQILGDAKTGIRENAVTSMNEEVHHFTTTEGREMDLTTAQSMELYLLSERKQAEDHLLKGGIVQPEIKIPGKPKIPRGTDVIHLSAEDIQSIVKALTPEQIRIADGLQKLTTGVLANYGNEASMKAYGYKKFTEQDYWPIKSAKEALHSSQEKDSGNVRSIKNIGMAQAVKPNAATPLSIRGVFDTFADHASDMIDYAAWLCPMEDANRLYNFQFRDSEGNLVQTVKGFLEEKGGQGSQQYWQKLMGDIQNGIKTKDFEPLTDKFAKGIGSFKGAAVGANVRVVIQQPTAFFRASAVLDPADMARGLTGGVTKGSGWEKALTHSPIAMRKDVGSFDISSPYTLNDRFYGKEGISNKINDKAGAPAGKADAITWGALWNACEWQVKRERPNLRAGSGEFYSAVNEVFTSMIDQTQVVDGILQRSNIMRGKSDLSKQATSFMGEPIMSLNVFMRAWDNMRYEENPAKRSKAIKNVGRAAAALLVTDVVNALAQSIADAGRDDDPDKDYWEKFLTALTGITGDEKTTKELLQHIVLEGNLGSNINKLGSIPFVKDILSLTQGYSVSRTDMQVFSDIVSASKDFTASMGGSGKKTREEALANMFAACSKLFGLPVANIKRDAMAAVRTAVQASGSVALEYEFEKFTYNIYSTANKSRYLNLAFKALEQGDLTTYEHIRKELKDFMALDNSSVDSSMRSKLDKEREDDEDFSLPDAAASLIGAKDRYGTGESESRFTENDLSSDDYIVYSRRKSELYSSMESGLENSQVFRAFTDDQKDKALSSAETYAKKTALHETDKTYEITDKWVLNAQEAQQKYGIKPEIYVALKTQVSDLESVKDRNGETIPNSKGLLIMQAVYNMPGLSEKQRNALFEYLGVGKSIRHYNKALVNEKVRKNARLAGK